MNELLEIYNLPISKRLAASKAMNRMNFHIDNVAFTSNVYWCRFSYNGYDSWNYTFHSHSFYELHYCLKGYAVFGLITGEKIKISAGEFVIFPTKTKHDLECLSDDFEKFVLGFDIQVKESEEKNFFLTAFGKEMSITNIASSEELYNIIAMILSRISYKKSGYKLAINELISLVITEVARLITAENEETFPDYANDDKRLETLIRFMKDNIAMDLSTDDIAKEMGLSAKQLNRLMTNTYGLTIAEFFRIEKVKKIKNLLLQTDLSIRDIAKKMNYSDEYAMNKSFKKVAGITPGTYRREYYKDEKNLHQNDAGHRL